MNSLNWREVLIALIILLALYVVVALVRMFLLKRKASTPTADSASQPLVNSSAVAAYATAQDPAAPAPPAGPAAASEFPWNEPPEDVPGQSRSQPPSQPRLDALEQEIGQLRKEVGGLRAELALFKDEFRRELSQSQVAQSVSPLYNDAMQMAVQGHDAMVISEHCGISRGEAELVVALARNPDL